MPVASLPASAAPTTAPLAAPAAAPAKTAFIAFLALAKTPTERLLPDLLVVPFRAELCFCDFFAADFLAVPDDFFALLDEADLLNFLAFRFVVGMLKSFVPGLGPQEAALPRFLKKRCLPWTTLWLYQLGLLEKAHGMPVTRFFASPR